MTKSRTNDTSQLKYMDIIDSISRAARMQTTYTVGLLQAKAYAMLTVHMSEALEPHGITPKEWALLGLVRDRKSIRPSESALELGVEAPYVTAMSIKLKDMGWMDEERDEVDTRAKILCLTTAGEAFVKKTEPLLREHMKPLVAGVKISDLLGYFSVLESITKNYNKKN